MQFPQSPKNIPRSRTMFASRSQTRGGGGRPLAGSCKWPNSPNFPSLGPASAHGSAWPGQTGPGGHCLAAWWPLALGWDLPRSLESGSLYTVHWRTVHCTGHWCTLDESLHICICNLLNQIVEKIFTGTSLIVSGRIMEEYFPPKCIRIRV